MKGDPLGNRGILPMRIRSDVDSVLDIRWVRNPIHEVRASVDGKEHSFSGYRSAPEAVLYLGQLSHVLNTKR